MQKWIFSLIVSALTLSACSVTQDTGVCALTHACKHVAILLTLHVCVMHIFRPFADWQWTPLLSSTSSTFLSLAFWPACCSIRLDAVIWVLSHPVRFLKTSTIQLWLNIFWPHAFVTYCIAPSISLKSLSAVYFSATAKIDPHVPVFCLAQNSAEWLPSQHTAVQLPQKSTFSVMLITKLHDYLYYYIYCFTTTKVRNGHCGTGFHFWWLYKERMLYIVEMLLIRKPWEREQEIHLYFKASLR